MKYCISFRAEQKMRQESSNEYNFDPKFKALSQKASIDQQKQKLSKQISLDNVQFKNEYKQTFFQGNQTKIGYVTFSLDKCVKKTTLLKFLYSHYDKQFIKVYHEKLRKKQFQMKLDQSAIDLDKKQDHQLALQAVKSYHYHSVLATDQEKFSLRKSEYRENVNILRLQVLWGISFLNLKKLDISGQKITSIEGLSFAEMPQLVKLQLNNNKITNIQALSKCNFKHCLSISLFDNPIITCAHKINQGFYPNLNGIILDEIDLWNLQENIDQKKIARTLQSIDFIFKLQSVNKLKQLRINENRRIFSEKVKKKLIEINQNIKFKGNDRNGDISGRLQELYDIGRQNDPILFRRFIDTRIEPLLRDRLAANQISLMIVTQIRARIYEQLHLLEQRRMSMNHI